MVKGEKITVTWSHKSEDGYVNKFSETYTRNEPEGIETRYWKQGMGYSGFKTDKAFKEYIFKDFYDRAETAYQRRVEDRARDERAKQFTETLEAPLRDVLKGLQEADDIVHTLHLAAEWHNANETIARVLTESHKEARRLLKSARRVARENVREEYASDYREAEDKDDFYRDYEDDIASVMHEYLR